MSQPNLSPRKNSPSRSPSPGSHQSPSHEGSEVHGSHIHHVEHVGSVLDKSAIVGPIGFLLLLGTLVYTFKEWYLKTQATEDQQAIPRLAHAVEEVQGWRRANYLAAGVMLATFAMIVLGMMWYRRVRAERAGYHESVYWGMSGASLLCLVFFILWRRKMRRHDAIKRQMKLLGKKSSKTKIMVTWGFILVILIGLIWYRRSVHLRRLAKKNEKLKLAVDKPEHQTVVSNPGKPPPPAKPER